MTYIFDMFETPFVMPMFSENSNSIAGCLRTHELFLLLAFDTELRIT